MNTHLQYLKMMPSLGITYFCINTIRGNTPDCDEWLAENFYSNCNLCYVDVVVMLMKCTRFLK